MRITIIGWYGTETIGDRAILAGLLSFFFKAFGDFEVMLGSLYPFFSARTFAEDLNFYRDISKKNIKFQTFASKKCSELECSIEKSDLVVMGGGPLMDLSELYMVEYAFKIARKLRKKTAILGCGVGPLFHHKYRRSVAEIVGHSSLTILRDSKSKEALDKISRELNRSCHEKILISYDPAVECAVLKKKNDQKAEQQDYIAINLREFPNEYSAGMDAKDINNGLYKFVASLSEHWADKEIRLIPMHYFHVGGDDRFFLNTIALRLNRQNIKVQNVNLTLEETMNVYQNAYFNVGMRFHSVVLQTILSGKNYILDYTEPKKGKIFGFLHDIDQNGFYDDRYVSLQQEDASPSIIQNVLSEFVYDVQKIEKQLSIYVDSLKALMS